MDEADVVVEGTGVQYEAPTSLAQIPPFDPRRGDHFWIIPVAFRVDPDRIQPGEPVNLDRENLVHISGVGCYYCERPYSRRIAYRRCRGKP